MVPSTNYVIMYPKWLKDSPLVILKVISEPGPIYT